MVLITLVAGINLGLGFSAAVYLGRGPKWRRARDQGELIELPTRLDAQQVQRIAAALDQFEQPLQKLAHRLESEPNTGAGRRELMGLVTPAIEEFERVADEVRQAYGAHATGDAGTELDAVQALVSVLLATQGRLAEQADSTKQEVADLVEPLLMTCREVHGVFEALLFVPMPA